MKKVIIETPYPCIIKTEKENQCLDVFNVAILEDERTIQVLPSVSNLPPFSIDLTNLIKNDNFITYETPDSIYISLSKPNQVTCYNIEKINYKNKTFIYKIGKNDASINTNNKKYNLILSPYQTYSISKVDNFICLHFKGEIENLFCLNVTNEAVSSFTASEIKIENNKILVKSESTSFYEIKEDKIIRVSSEANYFVNDKTLSLVFLNAIKKGQLAVAKSFLTDNLQQKSDDDLSSFFGKIDKIIPLSESQFLTFSNGNPTIYKILVKSNKIVDIDTT